MNDCALDSAQQYQAIAQAIHYIRANARCQPTLKEIAEVMGFSEYHLQRVFTAWAGVSPKRFLQYVTKSHALEALRASQDVLGVSLDAGLSGPGRLHDLMVSCEAMSPGEIKALGRGLVIGFGLAQTPFGLALLGWTPRGICHLVFCDSDEAVQVESLKSRWPESTLQRDDQAASLLSGQIFAKELERGKLHLVIRGTNFQIKVWEALLTVPSSQVVSYRQLAELAGVPSAQRAVGSALAANTVGYLIPCHRVIRSDGELGSFRWGVARKQAIQAWEACLDE
ncbi:methylated-DNA--[protein]-cysteine S-methyltransferase [Kistimonas asteriae]|uniref:methylated-DNA--[protein]-cysteine S-methyltransferase n=1 Tax=Kistimonas asteriae TaxID=517724 RepID=UPI001BAD6862|nr:methylated-DNA--[protein]-cysteine S-methyltransferase [Kistimonas asteriae]